MFWWELFSIEINILVLITLTIIAGLLFFYDYKSRGGDYWQSLNRNQKKWLVIAYVSCIAPFILMHIILLMILPLIMILRLLNHFTMLNSIIGISIFFISFITIQVIFHKSNAFKYFSYPLDVWNESLKTIGVNLNMKFDTEE